MSRQHAVNSAKLGAILKRLVLHLLYLTGECLLNLGKNGKLIENLLRILKVKKIRHTSELLRFIHRNKKGIQRYFESNDQNTITLKKCVFVKS